MISGNEGPHQIGSSVNITCSSDLSVQTIRWMNDSDNGRELFSNSGQQQLLLPIERVTSSLANTMYTCEVQVMLATGRIEVFQQAIVIQVHSSKKDIYFNLTVSIFTSYGAWRSGVSGWNGCGGGDCSASHNCSCSCHCDTDCETATIEEA